MGIYKDIKYGTTIDTTSIIDGSIVAADIQDASITDAKIVGVSSSKLIGALPAIDGSSLTGISSGGYSGTTVTGGFGSGSRGQSTSTTFNAWTISPPSGSPSGSEGYCIIYWSYTCGNHGNLSQTTLSGLGGPYTDGGQAYSNTVFNRGVGNFDGIGSDNRVRCMLMGEYTTGTDIVLGMTFAVNAAGPNSQLDGTYNAVFTR